MSRDYQRKNSDLDPPAAAVNIRRNQSPEVKNSFLSCHLSFNGHGQTVSKAVLSGLTITTLLLSFPQMNWYFRLNQKAMHLMKSRPSVPNGHCMQEFCMKLHILCGGGSSRGFQDSSTSSTRCRLVGSQSNTEGLKSSRTNVRIFCYWGCPFSSSPSVLCCSKFLTENSILR